MIEQSSIENLKNRLDIVDVIGEYIELKKSGANFKANCPFHSEKTPSFVVSPSKQIFHCFGCGVGGDAIKFVMDYEKLSYPEAVEKLAKKYNIHLTYTKDDKKAGEQKEVLEDLNHFYRKNLDKNQTAKNYLLDRGIYESTIKSFELGYAPSSSESMNFLNYKGISTTKALEVGAVAKGNDGRFYARFSQRVTFPIFNPSGKIVGFGGRTITNHPAKYINSPQSKVFDKSRLLYGYHKARQSISKLDQVIVCEGYLDVIMLHQAGFTNAIATLGTALTSSHIPILLKGASEVIVAYDGDEAGINAAFKASTVLSQKSVKGGVVIFEGGLDPADMVKEGKLEKLKELFSKPKPFVEFCFEKIISKYNINAPLQKEDALKEATKYLKTLSPILQEEYKTYLSASLNISSRFIKTSKELIPNQRRLSKKEDIAELGLIKTFLTHPHLIDELLNIVGKDVFVVHKEEFLSLLKGDRENPCLVGIDIRDDIKELSEEELKGQIINLLIIKNRQKLQQIKKDKTIDFNKKSFLLRRINENIRKLQKGELVGYESFSTI
jgi:DNA primase